MSQAEEASRRTFDRWAGSFDRSRLLAAWRAQALDDLELAPDDRFLDVACGGGRLVHLAAPLVSHAAGVDIAPRMLARARARAPTAEFRLGSAQQLPFEDGSFTVAACTAALHHFPEPAAAVGEIVRVLAPGGRALVADICTDTPALRALDAVLRRVEPGHVGFRPSGGIERLVADAGLSVVRTRHRLARAYALVLATKAASRSAP